jgi:hypothetical protein
MLACLLEHEAIAPRNIITIQNDHARTDDCELPPEVTTKKIVENNETANPNCVRRKLRGLIRRSDRGCDFILILLRKARAAADTTIDRKTASAKVVTRTLKRMTQIDTSSTRVNIRPAVTLLT